MQSGPDTPSAVRQWPFAIARAIGLPWPTPRDPLPAHIARVYALRSVERTVAEQSEAKVGLETGGVLVGFMDRMLNAIVITGASGPGPKAHHGRTTFNRDREFCQAFIDRHAGDTDGRIDFVGEWHKHPEPDPWPSSVDQRTYRHLAVDPDSHIDRPVILITGTVPERGPRRRRKDRYVGVNAFVFRADGFEPREVRWLPDEAYLDLLRGRGPDGATPAGNLSPFVPALEDAGGRPPSAQAEPRRGEPAAARRRRRDASQPRREP